MECASSGCHAGSPHDTSVFFATADADAAAMSGLQNMGYGGGDEVQWVTTDTYQLLNHQVAPHDDALECRNCHLSTSRINLQSDLGYAPNSKNYSTCADGCHSRKKAREWRFNDFEEFREGHKKHREKGHSCSSCHAFER